MSKDIGLPSRWLNFLCLIQWYGFSVSALWCPLATPTIFGFLLPWGWGYLFTAAPAKHSPWSLPWMRGISSRRPSWPSARNGSSRPSCAGAATTPWKRGCSSQQPPLASGVGLLLPAVASGAAPGLGCGVAPPGRRPCPRGQGSSSRPRRSLALQAAVPDLRRGGGLGPA